MPIDYKKYPPNWKTEIVPAVLTRAKDCCEFCELKNGQKVWSVRFKIQDTDGRYKYKSVWFSNINDAIRETKQGMVLNEVRVCLTVAHLDHDELNHAVELDRLKALCQICHLRYDAKEKYRRSFLKYSQ